MMFRVEKQNEIQKSQWYLCVQERVQGAFSFSELRSQILRLNRSERIFVWGPELKDWKEIQNTFEFEELAEKCTGLSFDQLFMQASPAEKIESISEYKSRIAPSPIWKSTSPFPNYNWEPVEVTRGEVPEPAPQKEIVQVPEAAAQATQHRSVPVQSSSRSWWILLGVSFLVAVFAGLAVWVQSFQTDASPVILDVLPADMKTLQDAMYRSQDETSAALAVSQLNPRQPRIFVGNRLPDGQPIDILVESIPEKVVGMKTISLKATVLAQDGLGRTPALTLEDGDSLPQGFYRVTAFCRTCLALESFQKPERIQNRGFLLSTQELFIGGQPDESYKAKIAAVHRALRERASLEILELRQIGQIIESEVTAWERSPRNKTEVESFVGQVRSLLGRAADPTEQRKLIYPSAYRLLSRLMDRVDELRTTPNLVVLSQIERKMLEADLASLMTRLDLAGESLKEASGPPTKIEF